MRERHEHLTCPAAVLSDVVLDDRVPAVEAVLVPQSVVDALGRVPLLPGKAGVVLEYPVYDPCVRSDPGSSGRLSSSVSRRHRVREHLAHGVSVQTEHPGRFPGAHAVYHAGSSDAKIQFHQVHPSHLPWALGIALWKVTDGPVFKRLQPVFEPSTRYTLSPPFTRSVVAIRTGGDRA